jgi:hypothetical protein
MEDDLKQFRAVLSGHCASAGAIADRSDSRRPRETVTQRWQRFARPNLDAFASFGPPPAAQPLKALHCANLVSEAAQPFDGRRSQSSRANCRLDAPDPHLASAARARCRSIRWRHSAYSVVPARYSNDLHHSSSESSRCIDEQLPSTSAATRNANLGIIASFPLGKPRPRSLQIQQSAN